MCHTCGYDKTSKAISLHPIKQLGALLTILFWTLKRVDIHCKICSEDRHRDSRQQHGREYNRKLKGARKGDKR